jgi:hypothetical protein
MAYHQHVVLPEDAAIRGFSFSSVGPGEPAPPADRQRAAGIRRAALESWFSWAMMNVRFLREYG